MKIIERYKESHPNKLFAMDAYAINLKLVYVFYDRSDKTGYIRLLNDWWGLHWAPKTKNMTFSERNGYTKLYYLCKWRFQILKPEF